jgi:HEAT repeat protein
MSLFRFAKPNIDVLKKTKDLEGLVNASTQPDEKISKAAVDALIELILRSYPPPPPPGGESLDLVPVPATQKILRLPNLGLINKVPRSLAIESLSEIIHEKTGCERTYGAAEMLIYLGAAHALEQFLLDTKQKYKNEWGHSAAVKCLTEAAVWNRDPLLLKKLMIAEVSFKTPIGCEELLLKEFDEKELLDIFIASSSFYARCTVCCVLGSVGGLASLSFLSSVASEGVRATLAKLDREDAKMALQKSFFPVPDLDGGSGEIYVVDYFAEDVQGSAKHALWRIIMRLPLDQLLPLCESDQKYLRNPAILAVCKAADPKALTVIISASRAKEIDVVAASIEALRKIGGPDAITALLPLLKHHSCQVWLSAAVALSEIGVQQAVSGILDLQPERILDPAVLNILARLNSIGQAVSALRAALEQSSRENRVAVIKLLTQVAPADQVAPLQDHFAQIYAGELNDDKWAVRNRAVDSLGRIGGALALTALKERLKNEADYEIRCEIEKILGLKGKT